MAIPLIVHIFKLHIFAFITNHLVNIPVSLFLGLGKYLAFYIALAMDITQLIIYYSVLNNTVLGSKLGWSISSEKLHGYKKPKFFDNLHNSWLYLGVFLLSVLPIYFGGIFAAVFTAHVLKLNKVKGFVVVLVGSIFGCLIWTIGIWSLIEAIIKTVGKLF